MSTSTAEPSSCQCIVTLYGRENGNREECIQNSIKVSKYARRFLCGRWSFSEMKLYKTCSDKPDENRDRTAEMMIPQFHAESCHPIFRASGAVERGHFESKEHGKKSTHFNDNEGNIELLLRTVISVYKLSIHGAIADLCKELNDDSAEDSHEDSESSGTVEKEEGPNEMDILCRIYNA